MVDELKGQGDQKVEEPIVDFHDSLVSLGLFFSQCIATPNLIFQSFVLDIAKGTVMGREGKPVEGYYARMKAALGAQNAKTKEIDALPILFSLTMPITNPHKMGRVTGFPIQEVMKIIVRLLNSKDKERPEFVRFKFSTKRDEVGGIINSINCLTCNENGGLIQIANPPANLKIVTD